LAFVAPRRVAIVFLNGSARQPSEADVDERAWAVAVITAICR
jgi:hypothetical protein